MRFVLSCYVLLIADILSVVGLFRWGIEVENFLRGSVYTYRVIFTKPQGGDRSCHLGYFKINI